MARTVTLCIHLGVVVLPRTFTLFIHLDMGFIAQNCYIVHTFICGLYCPELLCCVYIKVWAVLSRTVRLCIH